jgi:transposase
MFLSFINASIWLYPQPIDFRKQIDGLVMLIADHLQLNPTSGQIFLFRSRRANKIKILWWERNGFWLCYKRLEQGKLKFPKPDDAAMQLTNDQFGWLLSGLDFVKHTLLPEVLATNFY